MADPVSIFISYSHRDTKLRKELDTHLKLLQIQGIVSTWHDGKLVAGDELDRAIHEQLEAAKIILLLVSADFLASTYCRDIEMEKALQRHEAGQARVIPVMVRECDWTGAPFSKLLMIPQDAKPVQTFRPRDKAWMQVAQAIRDAAKRMSAP